MLLYVHGGLIWWLSALFLSCSCYQSLGRSQIEYQAGNQIDSSCWQIPRAGSSYSSWCLSETLPPSLPAMSFLALLSDEAQGLGQLSPFRFPIEETSIKTGSPSAFLSERDRTESPDVKSALCCSCLNGSSVISHLRQDILPQSSEALGNHLHSSSQSFWGHFPPIPCFCGLHRHPEWLLFFVHWGQLS